MPTLTGAAYAGQASAPAVKAGAERFEVSSIKAVRPALVNTIAALQKKDIAGARAAFETYESGWNGIEMYINTRSREMYTALENNYESKIAEGLKAANPDTAALLAEARAMLAKYNEAIGMVEKGTPLNPLFDDVARLRIVRANLLLVNPALKAGNLAKARRSYPNFRSIQIKVGGSAIWNSERVRSPTGSLRSNM